MLDISRFMADGVGVKTETYSFVTASASPVSIPSGTPVNVVSMGCTSETFYLVEFSYWNISTNTGAKLYGATNFGEKQISGATWNDSTNELTVTWAGGVDNRRIFVTVII